MAHKAACGEYTGGEAPYGFVVEAGRVVEFAAERSVIAEARTLRSAGLSLRAVAAELDRRGLRARSGRAFVAAQIARMVAA